jgi:hypothetical protein
MRIRDGDGSDPGSATLLLGYGYVLLLASRRIPVLEFHNSLRGARKRVGIGLSYRPARLHRLAKSTPWSRFLGSFKSLNIPSLMFPDLLPGQGGRGTRLPQQQHRVGRCAGQRRRNCRSCRHRPRRQVPCIVSIFCTSVP